jgi:hypothetical protein
LKKEMYCTCTFPYYKKHFHLLYISSSSNNTEGLNDLCVSCNSCFFNILSLLEVFNVGDRKKWEMFIACVPKLRDQERHFTVLQKDSSLVKQYKCSIYGLKFYGVYQILHIC